MSFFSFTVWAIDEHFLCFKDHDHWDELTLRGLTGVIL